MTDPAALAALHDVFGFQSFRGDQGRIVDHVIAGGDALVLMPTGGGKSLCFQLPAMVRPGTGLVVSPLIALMQDQVDSLKQMGVRAERLDSSLERDESSGVVRDLLAGRLDLLYVSPERLLSNGFMNLLDRIDLALLAIDEAHCISQWGHDFRPEYLGLSVLAERFPEVPRIALTATADEPTRLEILDKLGLDRAEVFVTGFDRPNIRYLVQPKDNARTQLLSFILSEHQGDAGIVYCMSRKKTEHTADWLTEHGLKAVAYHAGLEAEERRRRQDRFMKEEGLIVAATIAFGLGVDKPNVRFVAHLDPPKSLEAYYQETGRAGRDGLPADAWMVYGLNDMAFLINLINSSEADEERKRLELIKLRKMFGYCEAASCRRSILLSHFGEELETGCGNCDNCLSPTPTWDGLLAAQKALSCVYRTDQLFGVNHLINVLRGNDSDQVLRHGHQGLAVYGLGRDLNQRQWKSIFRQLLAMGALDVDREYGGLQLTPAARPILRGERELTLRLDRGQAKLRKKKSKAAPSAGLGLTDPVDQELFEKLRNKRLELAKEQSVPPYAVFHDRTLVEFALNRPTDLTEMADIHGVGQAKLSRYGKIFLDVIAAG